MSTTGGRVLRILGWIAGAIVALLLLLFLYVQIRWDAGDSRQAPQVSAPADSATLARGEYIYKYQSACWACHSAESYEPSSDYPPPVGGRLFDLTEIGPGFGKWYATNLTSDVETGLGGWTDGEIVQSLREGLGKDRTTLFPIMPTEWYHRMADDDVLAIVAYLRTLPPVRNPVPDSEPSFFAKALFTFGSLRPMEPITTKITAPERGITPEYGRYVSSTLTTCADCHTPRNLETGEFFMDSLFAGSSFAFGIDDGSAIFSYAANITPDVATGIGSWSEEQFLTAVTTGVRPDSTVLAPHMPYAYYKFWNEEDLRATFAYLQTIPAISRTVPANAANPDFADTKGVEHGGVIFDARCAACHGENGRGAPPTSVAMSEVAGSLTDEELTDFIRTGMIELKMPGFGTTLSADEMADLVPFIRSWEQ